MAHVFRVHGLPSRRSREATRRFRPSERKRVLNLESLEPRRALATGQGVSIGVIANGGLPWNEVNGALSAASVLQSVRSTAAGPSVTSFGQPRVGANGRLSLLVTFDGPVKVTGAPQIPFTVRGTQRILVYTDGGGGSTLRFTYRPRFFERLSTTDFALPAAPRIILPTGASIGDLGGTRARSLSTPSGITINTPRIAENNAVAAAIGTLSARDADGGRDRLSFTLVAGRGSADNSAFTIEGDRLRAADASLAGSTPISAGFQVTVIDVQPYAAVIASAIRAMEVRTGSETSEGLLWGITEGNRLPGLGQQSPEWLLPTQDAWGAVSAHDSSGVQARLLSSITNIIANATTVVDISSLTKVADGGFRSAIIEGARQAYQAGRSPVIRLLWGRTPLSLVEGDAQALQALWQNVRQAAPGLTVVATLMDDVSAIPKQVSWNHSKIVAADGAVALVGGINMWEGDYLQSKDPVTDLAIKVHGPAALSAHTFLDVLWRDSWSYRDHVGVSIYSSIRPGEAFPADVSGLLSPAPGEGTTRILTVGRAGHIFTGKVTGTRDDQSVSPADRQASAFNGLPNPMNGDPSWDGNNPSDTALRTLVDLARDEIIISQQMMEFATPGAAVGGLPHFDVRLFDALARRAAAGVKITIIVSGDKPTGAYTANPASTMRGLLSRLTILLGSRAKALQVGAENVQICSFRYSNADKWPGSGLFDKPRLHNKIIAVDSAVFYVGSQNAYPNELLEFGYIVESTAAVADLKRTYLDPMIRYSSRTALPWPTK
ncbi:MAG: phospholipase D-like domain-containing protein [Planctomycetota bacterium]